MKMYILAYLEKLFMLSFNIPEVLVVCPRGCYEIVFAHDEYGRALTYKFMIYVFWHWQKAGEIQLTDFFRYGNMNELTVLFRHHSKAPFDKRSKKDIIICRINRFSKTVTWVDGSQSTTMDIMFDTLVLPSK